MKNTILLILACITFAACSPKDKNMCPISHDTAMIGETITVSLEQSTDDVSVEGSALAVDNYYHVTVEFTTELTHNLVFNTPGYHLIRGYVYDQVMHSDNVLDSVYIKQ